MRAGTDLRPPAVIAGLRAAAVAGLITLCLPGLAAAQAAPEQPPVDVLDSSARPITSWQRRQWMAEQILSPRSVLGNLAVASWQTAVDSPREWQGSAGFTKRALTLQADTAMAKGIEASLGRAWGEDPRSTRSGREAFGSRLGHAATMTVLARRPDGHLAPAWARFAGIAGSNLVQNAWLPARMRTPQDTAERVAAGLVGRLAANLWVEFGPDLRRFAREQIARRPAPRGPRPLAAGAHP